MPALRRQGRAITKHISPHRILPGLDQAQNEEEEASSFDDELTNTSEGYGTRCWVDIEP